MRKRHVNVRPKCIVAEGAWSTHHAIPESNDERGPVVLERQLGKLHVQHAVVGPLGARQPLHVLPLFRNHRVLHSQIKI
jgi:hypothetical protein